LPEHRSAIAEEHKKTSLVQINKFVTTEIQEGVSIIEDRLMYIWVSMKPYVPLVYSEIKELFLLGMFALANLTYKADNRNLLVEEYLHDKVLSLAWVEVPEAKSWAQTIWKNIQSNSKPSEPPSLYAIVYNYLNIHHRK